MATPLPGDPFLPSPLDRFVSPPRPATTAWRRWGRNLVLFVLTAVSVFMAGTLNGGTRDGIAFAAALLAILGTHEMGHYVACRIHRVDATLPFFIPALWVPLGGWLFWVPIPFTGTFGAVIRIRQRFPHRKALFDIGIAGPLAGFVVCIPVLVLGLLEAKVVPETHGADSLIFGEPLLFTLAERLVRGPVPLGYDLSLGALGLAAWFGLLVTALNLIPVGQLDGGHVVYALFADRARYVYRLGWWACVVLALVNPSWLVWAVLLFFLGRVHPQTARDEEPLGGARLFVAVLGLLVFVLCLTPDPFPGLWKELGVPSLFDILRGR